MKVLNYNKARGMCNNLFQTATFGNKINDVCRMPSWTTVHCRTEMPHFNRKGKLLKSTIERITHKYAVVMDNRCVTSHFH